ncbi:FAD-dependent monooxygenase [Roseateles chitinivorans]|uniref:FAD-dependent monooxygenase n=1 Tax=Roseateles chitinivorans TaxID=2917965 RepID=UPI003D66ABB9
MIIGAGPVGMSAALEAARHGVRSLVIEQRRRDDPAGAKCNTVAARTMEIFRTFGIADNVRAAGLPDDFPTDVIYCTSVAGIELARIPLPSRLERLNADHHYLDSHWATPEPVVRVSQMYLEPILRRKLESIELITFMDCTTFVEYQNVDDHVVVRYALPDGRQGTVTAQFVIAADGGRSAVRKQMGVKLVGDVELGRTRSTLIRSAAIKSLFGDRRPAWMSWVVNHKVKGNLVAIDGRDTWLIHRALPIGEEDYDSVDLHQSIRDLLGVGRDFPYVVLSHEDWVGRRLVASRLRDDRVFLAGDAAHLWVPFAGYGMNAGIADGVAIAWKISAVLSGWSSTRMLDSYEDERLPITDQVSRYAMANLLENIEAVGKRRIPRSLSSRFNPVGAVLRKLIGRRLVKLNVPQFTPAGLNFGYFYDRSPVISYDGEPHPSYDMGSAPSSTVPGCRYPHHWLEDGASIYDRLGRAFTLLRFDASLDVGSLTAVARQLGLPIEVVDVPANTPMDHQQSTLILVRADQHIVWRGSSLPANVSTLLQHVAGR